MLGYSNGLTAEEVTFELIQPALAEVQLTSGAELAVQHVIKTAVETWRETHPAEADAVIAATTTTFLQGRVAIESFDHAATCFRLVEGGALVSVLNATHVRLVDDPRMIADMPHFEIIAPMTAVKVLQGEIPAGYLHSSSLQRYVDLRKRYIGE